MIGLLPRFAQYFLQIPWINVSTPWSFCARYFLQIICENIEKTFADSIGPRLIFSNLFSHGILAYNPGTDTESLPVHARDWIQNFLFLSKTRLKSWSFYSRDLPKFFSQIPRINVSTAGAVYTRYILRIVCKSPLKGVGRVVRSTPNTFNFVFPWNVSNYLGNGYAESIGTWSGLHTSFFNFPSMTRQNGRSVYAQYFSNFTRDNVQRDYGTVI